MEIATQQLREMWRVAGVLQRAAQGAPQQDAALFRTTAKALQERIAATPAAQATQTPAIPSSGGTPRLVDITV